MLQFIEGVEHVIFYKLDECFSLPIMYFSHKCICLNGNVVWRGTGPNLDLTQTGQLREGSSPVYY